LLKLPCPACNTNGIGLLAKFWSGAGSPARCANCDQLSYVHSSDRYGFQSGWPAAVKLLSAALCTGAYFFRPEVAFFWLLAIIWVACGLWELRATRMRITSAEESARSNWTGYLLILVLLLALLSMSYFAH